MTGSNFSTLNKPMRPIVITNFIFTTYMSITSIFYFLSISGYYFFTKNDYFVPDLQLIDYTLEAQLVYCLAHASYASGLVWGYRENIYTPFEITSSNIAKFTIKFTFVLFVLGTLAKLVSGFSQFSVLFLQLSLVASTLSLSAAVIERNAAVIFITASLFITNEINALMSGWKESVIVPFLLLGTNLYPYYKKLITIILPIVMLVIFYFIPSFNETIRANAWSGDTSSEVAAELALEKLKNSNTEDLENTNWAFLTNRISEIGMLNKYVAEVPSRVDYFGLQIIGQGFMNIIPRIFYPDKPNIEVLVMERVIKIGVIEENISVSAKPQTVADAYITGGYFAIILVFITIGFVISWCSNKAEFLFGGYTYGAALIHTGLFQIFWRGNCFEFLFNSIFWGIFLMYSFHYIGRKIGVIKEKNLLI